MILVYISSNVRGDQRVEAEFLDWDTELGELPLVCLYHVGVSLANFLELVLYLLYGLVLQVFDLLQSVLDHTQCLGVDLCSSQ